jgi:predicted GNAT superfamily acetyltransferase
VLLSKTNFFEMEQKMKLDNENIRDTNPVGLRLPTELKEKIKNAAKENKQSINAEIVRRLEASFNEGADILQCLAPSQKEYVLQQVDFFKDMNERVLKEIKIGLEQKK